MLGITGQKHGVWARPGLYIRHFGHLDKKMRIMRCFMAQPAKEESAIYLLNFVSVTHIFKAA